MTPKERIYDAFGELVYVVAMADGLIREEEVEALDRILQGHPKAKEIKWSFDYERRKNNDIDDVYNKVINRCQDNGPDPEYEFLIQMLERIAEASEGIEKEERQVIDRFVVELLDRFRKDIKSINEE